MMLTQGLTLRQAAAMLGVSLTTVKTHLDHLFEKTGSQRQTDLVRLAIDVFPPSEKLGFRAKRSAGCSRTSRLIVVLFQRHAGDARFGRAQRRAHHQFRGGAVPASRRRCRLRPAAWVRRARAREPAPCPGRDVPPRPRCRGDRSSS